MQAEISRFRCKIVQTAPKTQLISPFNQKRIKKTQRHKRNNAARRVHFHTCSPLLVHRYNSAPCAHFESRLSLTPRRPRFAEKKRSDPHTSTFFVQRLGQKPPILRGRDIKRYGYEWAELWIIGTHNGVRGKFPRIDIEEYPAVKAHLDQYWEDFDKPKIIYPNMTKFLPFYYDENGYLTNQKCFIVTGKKLGFLTAFLNSSLFKFCFRENFPELLGGTRELSKVFFDKLPILLVDEDTNAQFAELVQDIQQEYTTEKAMLIDECLFNLYDLTEEERKACQSTLN